MFLSLFQWDPSAAVAFLLGLVIGITVHEASHATSAYLLGDDTAYRDGRVTLNPVSHLDLLRRPLPAATLQRSGRLPVHTRGHGRLHQRPALRLQPDPYPPARRLEGDLPFPPARP